MAGSLTVMPMAATTHTRDCDSRQYILCIAVGVVCAVKTDNGQTGSHLSGTDT